MSDIQTCKKKSGKKGKKNAIGNWKSFNADLEPISNVRAVLAFYSSCGSMDDMDVDAMFDMPGGDDFRNVTKVFKDAARG